IDRNADTWTYAVAALNPKDDSEPWHGDADTHSLQLAGMRTRTGGLICPWCSTNSQQIGGWHQFWPAGNAQLSVQDGAGHTMGVLNGQFVNTIPGAHRTVVRGGKGLGDPSVYYVPGGAAYTVTLGGTGTRPPPPALPGAPALPALNTSKPGQLAIF